VCCWPADTTAANRIISLDPARVKLARGYRQKRVARRCRLERVVVAPASDRSVGPDTARVYVARCDCAEGSLWRRCLPDAIAPPARAPDSSDYALLSLHAQRLPGVEVNVALPVRRAAWWKSTISAREATTQGDLKSLKRLPVAVVCPAIHLAPRAWRTRGSLTVLVFLC
jgi:hypothetical protein